MEYLHKYRRMAMRNIRAGEYPKKYEELDDATKQKALDKNRYINVEDNNLAADDMDWIKEQGSKLGFEIDKVYYSGFASQGDGASWTGYISLEDWLAAGAKDQFPLLWEYGKELGFDGVSAVVTQSGRYSHSHPMSVDAHDIELQVIDEIIRFLEEEENGEALVKKFEQEIGQATGYSGYTADDLHTAMLSDAQDYADKIYRNLEDTYDALTSDEAVAETLTINDYDIFEDGVIGW